MRDMKVIAGKCYHKSNEYNPVFGCSNDIARVDAYWWECDLKNIKVGDFAIVENRDSYAMVEVICIADVDEENVRLVCGTSPNKKVIAKIDRKTLDALSNGEKVDLEVALGKKKPKTTKK